MQGTGGNKRHISRDRCVLDVKVKDPLDIKGKAKIVNSQTELQFGKDIETNSKTIFMQIK